LQRLANPLAALLTDLPAARPQLSAYLAEHAATRGCAEAAVESGRRLTYAQLAEEVSRLASLLEQLGVTRGTRVAVLAPPSIDFLVSFLATTALGGVWLGLNPKHTRAELQYVLKDAAPRVVLARDRIAGRDYIEDLRALLPAGNPQGTAVLFTARPDAADLPHVAQLLANCPAQPAASVPARASATDPAMLVYTSGSTGAPKGALISHGALIRGALVRTQIWAVDPLRALNNLPINHIGCVGDIACTCVVAGGCQVFMEKFDAAATLQWLAQERVSFWYQVPTMFQLCLEHPAAAHTDWSNLDIAIWSGGRASRELILRMEKVARRLGVDYSMTESVGSISLTPGTLDHDVLIDTVGWPDPGRGVRLADPQTGQPVATGQPGEVQIHDDWRFSGYATSTVPADAFASDGWFRTGDLAVWREDGTIKLVGRLKEMFKSGGYNVYPKEIEQLLESHLDVAGAAVVPTSDPLYGEVGVAFVVARHPQLTPATLQAFCRDSLANYKIPKRFVLLDEFPLLPTGKIDRVALRERAGTLLQ
jgi:acyl-CoA synthetase (AMP-forming)/AMP-acid ligase II